MGRNIKFYSGNQILGERIARFLKPIFSLCSKNQDYHNYTALHIKLHLTQITATANICGFSVIIPDLLVCNTTSILQSFKKTDSLVNLQKQKDIVKKIHVSIITIDLNTQAIIKVRHK